MSWANEFKSDSNMSGLLRFVDQLHKDGISFQGLQQSSSSAPPSHVSHNPTSPRRDSLLIKLSHHVQVTPSSNEDLDFKRAIQLSLRDSNPAPPTSSLYPSVPTNPSPTPAVKKVRTCTWLCVDRQAMALCVGGEEGACYI